MFVKIKTHKAAVYLDHVDSVNVEVVLASILWIDVVDCLGRDCARPCDKHTVSFSLFGRLGMHTRQLVSIYDQLKAVFFAAPSHLPHL